MLGIRVIHRMPGLERTVVEAAEFAQDDAGEYLAGSSPTVPAPSTGLPG